MLYPHFRRMNLWRKTQFNWWDKDADVGGQGADQVAIGVALDGQEVFSKVLMPKAQSLRERRSSLPNSLCEQAFTGRRDTGADRGQGHHPIHPFADHFGYGPE